jgi:hypothetical protein
MIRANIVTTWVGVVATLAIVLGGIVHSAHADPEGTVASAHGADHGIAISRFRG